MNRLGKLAKRSASFADFLYGVKAWPRWFLTSEAERRMGKIQLEQFYFDNH